jgi:hypothetical protein
MNKYENPIVATKKCNDCRQKVYIVNKKFTRVNGSIYRTNVELPHYCDGGESWAIEQQEKAIVEGETNYPEYYE